MEETACEQPKELTKFEKLSNEVDNNTGNITSIFQTVSNLEDKLGERKDSQVEDSEKAQEPTSIIELNTQKIQRNNRDLSELRTRLENLKDLF